LNDTEPAVLKKSPLAWAKVVFRLVIVGLVAWGVWRTGLSAAEQFRQQGFSLLRANPLWLLASGVLYALGQAPSWVFWRQTLWAMGQRPTWWETLRAYYVGSLGKYVPGKAMVVVIRTDLVRSERVNTTVAAVSVFVETLTMMAVGSAFAVLMLLLSQQARGPLLFWALVVGVCAGAPTILPVFRRLVRLVGVKRANPQIDAALAGLNLRLMASGWAMVSLGWAMLGLSLWAVLHAMPGAAPALVDLPMIEACVALAMVLGFVSLIPGGLGVRELVVMTLLAPTFGEAQAIVSAVLLRLVWLFSELTTSSLLYLITSWLAQRKPAAPHVDQ